MRMIPVLILVAGWALLLSLVYLFLVRIGRAARKTQPIPDAGSVAKIHALETSPPSDSSPIAEIRRAIKHGEILRIRYHGGSSPGSVREILPKFVRDDLHITAICIASKEFKCFRVDRMDILAMDDSTPDYRPPVEPATLTDAISSHLNDLKSLGWHVAVDARSVSLHRRFKNRNPRKTADVTICHWEENSSWQVTSVRFDRTRTFKKLSGACSLFLTEARELAPGALQEAS